VALGPDGTVLARTDEPAPQPTAQREHWLEVALATPGEAAVVELGKRPGVAVATALEAAGTVFGYLAAAQPLDQRFAEAVGEATQDGVVLLSDGAALGTTLRSNQNPWRSLEAWRAEGGSAGTPIEVRLGTETYFAREVTLATRPAVSAIIVRSRAEAFAPYDRAQRTMLAVLFIVVAAAMAIAVWGPSLVRRTHR
jgi:hypothetical protein